MAKQGMKKNASFHACEMEVDSKPEETPSVLQEISLTFGIVAKGCLDACYLPRLGPVIRHPKLKRHLGTCLVINFVLIVLFHVFFTLVVSPICHKLLHDQFTHRQYLNAALNFFDFVFGLTYYLGWAIPLYFFSTLINADEYGAIAEILSRGANNNSMSLAQSIRENITGLVLIDCSYVLIFAVGKIPWIGPILSFVSSCWLWSFCLFDYRLTNQDSTPWKLETRLDFIECHWAYFLGFGAPLALVYIIFPYIVAVGIAGLLFPVFMILSFYAVPLVTPSETGCVPSRVRIFEYPEQMTDRSMRIVFAGWRRFKPMMDSIYSKDPNEEKVK